MYRTPTLTSLVSVQWQCPKGLDRECDVTVEYTFDGVDDLEVLAADVAGGVEPYGIDPDAFDALVDAAVAERAAEAYGDWLSGQDGSDD